MLQRDRSQLLMTAKVKRGGFRVALGKRGLLTLGGRDFIVILRVGGFNITLGIDNRVILIHVEFMNQRVISRRALRALIMVSTVTL
jgi:hypothetical protein